MASVRILPRVSLGDPILRSTAPALDAQEIQSLPIQNLLKRMYYTLKRTGGIGLAAPQVGVSLRVAVVNISALNKFHSSKQKRERFVMINPDILIESKKTSTIHEGCLSFIDIFGEVARPSQVKVRYLNEKGDTIERTLNGLAAKVFQHELDHMNGVVWIDRATDSKTFMTQSEYKKMKLKSMKDN